MNDNLDFNVAMERMSKMYGEMITVEFKTCDWCGEHYEKTMPGHDVCGNCQVAWVVKEFWHAVLFSKWFIPYYDVETVSPGKHIFIRKGKQ